MMPDYAAAIVAHLRANTELTAIVPATRIVMEMPNAAGMPKSWVLVRKAGGTGAIASHPYARHRLDIHSYGASAYEAFRVSRAVQAALIPESRSGMRIHQQGCVIPKVWQESGHLALEAQEGWPFVLSVYGFLVYEAEVSEE